MNVKRLSEISKCSFFDLENYRQYGYIVPTKTDQGRYDYSDEECVKAFVIGLLKGQVFPRVASPMGGAIYAFLKDRRIKHSEPIFVYFDGDGWKAAQGAFPPQVHPQAISPHHFFDLASELGAGLAIDRRAASYCEPMRVLAEE